MNGFSADSLGVCGPCGRDRLAHPQVFLGLVFPFAWPLPLLTSWPREPRPTVVMRLLARMLPPLCALGADPSCTLVAATQGIRNERHARVSR